MSGSKESRPSLNRLLAEAKRRKFDAVLVYRYDRFATSLRQLVNALAEFDAMGTGGIVSANKKYTCRSRTFASSMRSS